MSRRPQDVDLLTYERELLKSGYRFVAGIDEAGRGPLAGPVVAACVVMDLVSFVDIPEVYDSKALTARQRFLLWREIRNRVYAWGIGIVGNEEIDQVNIYQATKIAMKKAYEACGVSIDAALVDAMPLSFLCPYFSVVKGDQKSFLIASASIVAKVTRDAIMDELHFQYPCYRWDKNRGYPTREHREAIHLYGLSPFHRKSFDCYGKNNLDIYPPSKKHAE